MAPYDDSRLLIDIVTAIVARAGADWTIDAGAFWCSLSPPDGRMLDQGWKLHVSATQLSAPVVLSRAADVLIAEGCAFKFARGLDELASLLSSRCDRGSGGKFITAYPVDDETFGRVAARLDLATDGWCSGSSGVGTFLIRLWSVTGEPRFRDLAEAGAVAIRRAGWYSSTAACHGLAGDGEFLLDLAACTGEHRYHEWAEELAAIAHTRHTIRDGLAVLPDESGIDTVAVGYNTGRSGVLGFLLRLRHGGQRWWMPDKILAPEGKWPAIVARTSDLTVH